MNALRFFGVVPFGIGLTVLFFVWTSDFGPLFFRVFASFVALGFVMFGGAFLFGPSMLTRQQGQLASMLKRVQGIAKDQATESESPVTKTPKVGYACASCGAALGSDAEVSPSGDVKCSYCQRWFNIHKS